MSDTPSGNADMSLRHEGLVATNMHCHNCSKGFIAELDYSINGNHTAHCPHCGHEHLRTIIDGRITDKRWGSSDDSDVTKTGLRARRTWKHDILQIETSSAAEFLRNRWFEKFAKERNGDTGTKKR